MGLKPGHVNNFNDSMAAAIEEAFRQEWLAVHNAEPTAGKKDRQLLFAAISCGILNYLSSFKDEIASNRVTLKDSATQTETTWGVAALELDIEDNEH